MKHSTQNVPIDWVKPYWRNPRRVPEEAVNALAESIKAYGYQQPIVTDEEGVIIIGHTRYAAMRKIGVTDLDVMIVRDLTPAQVKQLRVIDNRAAEYTSWDFEALLGELSTLDSDLITALFPEIAINTDADSANLPNSAAIAAANEKWDAQNDEVEFVCPSCFHSWEQKVTREELLAGELKVKETTNATA